MFESKGIDADEATDIMGFAEGHYLDLKRIDIRPSKLTETVSAFANTAGGELFVGVGESSDKKFRIWRGFENFEAANNHIHTIEGMSPLGNHYNASFISSPGEQGLILHIVIFKTTDILNASDGNAYVRRNAQNQRVVGDEALRRLRLDKGIVSFEDDVVNTNKEYITDSLVTTGFIIDVIPSAQPEEWMAKQNLLVGERPTVAGVLLFSDEPQAALPKRSAVKVYRYKTRDEEGARETLAFNPLTIEGCLYDQIRQTVSTTKALVEDIKRLGEKGLEDVVYPDETLHEIITNAVLHRDYSIPSSYISSLILLIKMLEKGLMRHLRQ